MSCYECLTTTRSFSSYKLTENIDAQLKRMSSNLKEIIDRINCSSSSLNSDNVVSPLTAHLTLSEEMCLGWRSSKAVEMRRKSFWISFLRNYSRI